MVASQNTSLVSETLFEEHYKKFLPEAQALPADDVLKVNLDAAAAVTSALAIVPMLGRFRETIAKNLLDFNLARFDQLGELTMSFSVANSRYLSATKAPDAMAEDYELGLKQRELLLSDVRNLVTRGLINASALKEYTGLIGFRNVGMELQLLALLLKDNWQSIQGRCASDLAELEGALKLAQRLQRGAGEREVNPAIVAEFADIRNRMFTLFITAYDDARRAINYLRWHEEDADDIAPSLHVSRGSGAAKKKSEKNAGSVPASAASTVQASPVPVGTVVPPVGSAKTGTDSGNGPYVE